MHISLLEIRKMACYYNNSLDCKELCKHTYAVSVYKYSSMGWHKRKRTNMLSVRTISTSLSRWHLHLSGRKRDYRERIFRKNSMPDETSRWLRAPFERDEKGIHAEMNPKAHGRSLQNMWYDTRNVSWRIRVCRRKLCPLFTGVTCHLFFLWFPLILLIRSFTRS